MNIIDLYMLIILPLIFDQTEMETDLLSSVAANIKLILRHRTANKYEIFIANRDLMISSSLANIHLYMNVII